MPATGVATRILSGGFTGGGDKAQSRVERDRFPLRWTEFVHTFGNARGRRADDACTTSSVQARYSLRVAGDAETS